MDGRRPTLVVLRALGIGDLLTAVPALRALADAFPGYRRLLAAPESLTPLVRLVDPDHPPVHAVVDTGELDPIPVDAHGAELAVNLHGRGPESHRLVLAARPGRLIAFRHGQVPETAGAPSWVAGEHEVERWCRLLSESGIPADPSRIEIPPPLGGSPPLPAGYTLIHPGAACAARCWPADRWAEVARRELERGRPVVLTGSKTEADLARRIAGAARLPDEAVLAGSTDLGRLARLVASAARVACGDTGVAHLATALGRPSVVLFGPTPPSQWGPPVDRRRHRVLWGGRTGDPHGSQTDRGLLAIEAAEVVDALGELTGTERREPARAAP